MRTIPLTQGKHAIVDADDYDRLVAMGSWYLHNTGYATRNEREHPNGKQHLIYMHRIIVDCPTGSVVDHWDSDPLNNQKANLRICTQRENLRNQHQAQANSRSGIKGVYWVAQRGKWRTQIQIDGKLSHLGYFKNPLEAAAAYDKAALELFGEFANLNNLTEITTEHAARLEACKV